MRLGHKPMRRRALLAGMALVPWLVAPTPASAQRGGGADEAARASGSLTPFRSDRELRRFLRQVQPDGSHIPPFSPPAPPPSPPPPSAPGAAPAESNVPITSVAVEDLTVTGTGDSLNDLPATTSITNTQEADVDEGGIVKMRGDILVILRRGRLFTVSLAGGGMRAVDSIDAFPPGVDGSDDWYDEMLVHGDRVIVIGYSYGRGGTEINRFRLDAEGRLAFEDSYHLRSDDYYSARNYASRLIGRRLILYSPLPLEWEDDPLEALPGLRKWERGHEDGEDERPFRRIARARNIYIVPSMRDGREIEIDTLHSVTECDLTAPVLDCSAIGVLGPESDTFYVSSSAVWLWVGDYWSNDEGRQPLPAAFLYRLPFGRERPSAIGTQGAPVDQFSFREDAADGIVNVLLREWGGGDSMGGPEVSGGDVALLQLPIAELGDGSESAARRHYRPLPGPDGSSWSFRNRFVGGHVLYGGGEFDDETPATLFAAPLRGGDVAEIRLGHAIGRIEALGRDALVVGGGAEDALGFSAIELPPRRAPVLGDVFSLPAAQEGETRSHAFFFRPTSADGASGILGLPIARPVEEAYQRFFGSAAAMLFLRRDQRRFAEAGELAAEVEGVVDDDCVASCVDWYGNARPIFLGERVFALLGYELVEGRMIDGRIREIGRLDYSPRPAETDSE